MPLNRQSVAEADRRFYEAHPERKGKPLTKNPEDAPLRQEWMAHYRQAATGQAPAAPSSPAPACSAAVPCAPPKPSSPRRFLCLRSNVAADVGKPGFIAGHSMLSLHENGTTTTYGAWPDSHSAIQAAGLANGDASDVRTDFKGDDVANYPYAHCRELSEEQYKTFKQELSKSFEWGYFNNCATFAAQTFTATTGEKVRATELFGSVETPRAVGKYIREANQGANSNLSDLQSAKKVDLQSDPNRHLA